MSDTMNDPETSRVAKEVKTELFKPDAAGLKIGEVAGFSDKELKATYAQACQMLQAGQHKSAAKLFGLLCALEHDNPKNFRGLGLTMQKMNFTPVAEFMYRRALHLNADDVISRCFLAEILLKQRRYGAARLECERAIEDGRRLGKPDLAAYVKRSEKLLGFINGAGDEGTTFEK